MRRGMVIRLLFVSLLGVFLLVLGTPEVSAGPVPGGDLLHDDHSIDSDPSGGLSGHCHPGLDCSVTAIFTMPAELEAPVSRLVALEPVLVHLFSGWSFTDDPPPPRSLI